jgi:hypothetical protein
MFDTSGGTAEERRVEAVKIVDMIMEMNLDKVNTLKVNDYTFVMNIRENLLKYGSNAFISPRQLFYLRDVKDKLL